jgi:phosphohistidine swiveling domain-containing protein
MKLYKKVVIIVLMLAFIASMGAASVSAQTSDSVTSPTVQAAASSDLATVSTGNIATAESSVTTSAPIVGVSYKTPTVLQLFAASQSVKLNDKTQWVRVVLQSGTQTWISGQKVDLYAKIGTGNWFKYLSGTTAVNGAVTWYPWSSGALIAQFRVVYSGMGTYAGATSNIITIKYENTKTTPYQTTLYANAEKPVVATGTTAKMWARLQSGATPLTSKYVYVWKWSGGKWVIVSRVIVQTGVYAGWATATYKLNHAGTGLYQFTFFGPLPYDRSTSNGVQIRWT